MNRGIQSLLVATEIINLRAEWNALDRYQRGDRLLALRRSFSIRQLAQAVGCSPKSIRNFLFLASVPKSERWNSTGRGAKKILADIRTERKIRGGWRKLMATAEGRRLENKLTNTLRRWVRDELSPWCWDAFFDEVLNLPETKRHIRRSLPNSTECQPRGDWKKIIAATRPPDDPGSLRYQSLYEYWVRWLAGWYLRCMPVGYVAQRVFLRVRQQLRQEARKLRGEAWLV